jgi:hypothetical protein
VVNSALQGNCLQLPFRNAAEKQYGLPLTYVSGTQMSMPLVPSPMEGFF